MTREEILSRVDHTLLAPAATWEQIQVICDDAARFHTATICIPPSFVKKAADYIQNEKGVVLPVCTVIGFPNGYNETIVKCKETEVAVENGAQEIDMVINIGWLKEKRNSDIVREIQQIKESCNGRTLKVIIETCLLTDEEKIAMCENVSLGNADYIKTSTGFSKGGATIEDIRLFKQYCRPTMKIKAAGGISSFDDAEAFIGAGADRLGTSRLVKLMKEQ